MYKKALRKDYKQKRRALSDSLIEEASLSIANKLLEMPIWHFFYYHIFLSISKNNEVKTEPILSILLGKDKNIIIPKVGTKGDLQNYLLTDGTTIKKNRFGIPEPVEGLIVEEKTLDVVFVPLLAFDQVGNRVGYGGGYYDRFLKKCRPDTLKIGLSFFEAESQIIDVDNQDVPLDYCITPNKVYSFRTEP